MYVLVFVTFVGFFFLSFEAKQRRAKSPPEFSFIIKTGRYKCGPAWKGG
jgi:hypothetical protein